jgi:predicted enzyme related to lactoylglutathione lyase
MAGVRPIGVAGAVELAGAGGKSRFLSPAGCSVGWQEGSPGGRPSLSNSNLEPQMSNVTAYQPGTPCWIDLMTPDQQAALDFYRDLFGWQGEIGPPETGGYAMCTLRGEPVAGIMATQPGGPPGAVWTTYLASADADATQAAITANGGTVLAPAMDVMTLGRMLVANDPTGATVGVWQAVDFHGAAVVNEPGALVWNELNTTDTDAAAAFYQNALGIRAVESESAEGYLTLQVGDRPVGGMQALDKSMGAPPYWLAYFAVDDVDITQDALVRAGGDVLLPPSDIAMGRLAIVRDPQGGVFGLFSSPSS